MMCGRFARKLPRTLIPVFDASCQACHVLLTSVPGLRDDGPRFRCQLDSRRSNCHKASCKRRALVLRKRRDELQDERFTSDWEVEPATGCVVDKSVLENGGKVNPTWPDRVLAVGDGGHHCQRRIGRCGWKVQCINLDRGFWAPGCLSIEFSSRLPAVLLNHEKNCNCYPRTGRTV